MTLIVEQRGPTCIYCGRRPCRCIRTVVRPKSVADPEFLAKLQSVPAECDCHYLAMGFGDHRADCSWIQLQKSKREVLATKDSELRKAARIVNRALNAALEKGLK